MRRKTILSLIIIGVVLISLKGIKFDKNLVDKVADTSGKYASEATEKAVNKAGDALVEAEQKYGDQIKQKIYEKVTDTVKGLFNSVAEQIENIDFNDEDSNSENIDAALLSEAHTTTESKLEPVELKQIVDGDTLVVSKEGQEYKVRFIGMDTPESVNSDESKNNEYGTMASEHTKILLKDVTTLYLSYDVQETDQYGRTLAYVWLTDTTENPKDNMLNAIILRDGYAVDKVYEPNKSYADTFKTICNEAVSNKLGLWQYKGYHTLTNR